MLKFIVDNLDEVPEGLRDNYSETLRNGKTVYCLQVEGAVSKDKLDEFRTNNISLRKQLEDFQSRFGNITLSGEELGELIAKREQFENFEAKGKDKVEELVEKRLGAARAEHERQIEGLRSENETMKQRLSDVTIDQSAVAVATKRGLKPSAIPDLTNRARGVFRLKDGVPTAYESDGKTVRYGKEANPLTVDEWVEGLTAEAPHLFNESSGGGASGERSGGPNDSRITRNPWKSDTFNLTEQMKITKKDPKQAARLKADAGK
jgi:hypothetical protein